MMRRNDITKTIILIILGLNLLSSNSISNVSGLTGAGTQHITGSLEAKVENDWEDSNWQFFSVQCELEETVIVNLTYEGDLNLDLWLYVDEDSTGSEQKNFATDLTHCGMVESPHRYSSIESKNTTDSMPEIVVYTNLDFSVARKVYILILAHDGLGSSFYEMESNKPITPITGNDIEPCYTMVQAWSVFGVFSVILFFIVYKLAKRSALTPEQKAQIKLDKEEKKNNKMKKKGKVAKKTTMASRGSSGRRR